MCIDWRPHLNRVRCFNLRALVAMVVVAIFLAAQAERLYTEADDARDWLAVEGGRAGRGGSSLGESCDGSARAGAGRALGETNPPRRRP